MCYEKDCHFGYGHLAFPPCRGQRGCSGPARQHFLGILYPSEQLLFELFDKAELLDFRFLDAPEWLFGQSEQQLFDSSEQFGVNLQRNFHSPERIVFQLFDPSERHGVHVVEFDPSERRHFDFPSERQFDDPSERRHRHLQRQHLTSEHHYDQRFYPSEWFY